jgi:hypothetical protein
LSWTRSGSPAQFDDDCIGERDHVDASAGHVGAGDGAIDHAPQDRLQPVVARGMEMVGLGGGEQNAVGAWAQQRADNRRPW